MTAEELLAAMAEQEPLVEDRAYCTIDPETRVITIPPEYQLLGVESDEKAERLYFKCPKIVGDNIDLTTLALRVNFRNAGAVVDQYLVDDAEVDGDDITFSWLLSRRVTQYEGTVSFIVCAVKVSGEVITNEWNTTLAEAEVLEGLEVEVVLPEEETDIVNQLLSLAETRLNDVKKATADANTAASNANQKAQEAENAAEDARAVTEQITKDSYLHTALQSFIDTVTATPTAYGNAIVKRIEGFTRQETTTGAQLFDVNNLIAYNEASFSVMDNGRSIKVTGKMTEEGQGSSVICVASETILNLIKGKSIHIYVDHNASLGWFEIGFNSISSGWTYRQLSNKQWTTINIPSDVKQVNFSMIPNRQTETDVTVLFNDIKIGLTQFETWEPYTGGQPAPNPDYPMVVQGVGYRGFFDGELLQGYWDVDSSDFISYANYICNKNKIPCKANDEVNLLIEDTNITDVLIIFFDEDDKKVSYSVGQTGTAPSNASKFAFRYRKTGITPETAGNITVTINDKYAVAVKSEGKNILDFEEFLNSRGSQYTKSGDRYRLTGTGTAFSNPIILSDEDEDFTLSGSVISESGNGYSVQLLNKAGNTVATLRNEVTNISGKGCKIRLNYSEAGAGIYENIMVEKGTSHDKYIPYQGNTTYIPVDYPLFEGDKIIQRNGEYKLIRKWGYRIFDGSEDEEWGSYSFEGSYQGVYFVVDDMKSSKRASYFCSHFRTTPYENSTGIWFGVDNNFIFIIFGNSDIATDVTTFVQWLKSNPMSIAYELAEPTEEPLSPEAQKALHSIVATDEETELTIVGVPSDAGISNQFLVPRNTDGALNTTAYCTAKKNKIVLNELVAQNLDARVNKLEIDNAALAEQTIVVE